MRNNKPLLFGAPCPKCEAKLRGDYRFCTNIDCKTWKVFGGEHLHIQCSMCKYIRTTHCADFEKKHIPPVPPVEDINKWLDGLVEEYNYELEPDWEPNELDT